MCVLHFVNPPGAWATSSPLDLKQLSLEDLVNLEVTSVSKTPEKLSRAAAAVSVITRDEIRRSGATSIPEALRMVPGLQVAQIDANKWVVTSRGFAANFANKLLVMIDGRSVYTPLFSGVYWDVQDVLLQDIERIEVIRGPGATLWGANAVNGVINIITRTARESQGTLLKAGGGSEERGFGSFRHGARLGRNGFVRFYGKYFNRSQSIDSTGADAADQWNMVRGGFRADWRLSGQTDLTLQGDIYRGDAGVTYAFPMLSTPYVRVVDDEKRLAGGNLLARWARSWPGVSQVTLQAYFDRTERADQRLGENRNTFDLDYQQWWLPVRWLKAIWGLGYRSTTDEFVTLNNISLYPEQRSAGLFSMFAQTDLMLADDRLRLTLGSKFENNDYTGFELQPSVRLLWSPEPRHTVWAAVSRAVRTPSRIEYDGLIPSSVVPPGTIGNASPFPVLVVLEGNRAFESEELVAYETGYRVRPGERVLIDAALFYNDYDQLRTLESGVLGLDSIPVYALMPLYPTNNLTGRTFGAEAAMTWRVHDRLRLRGAYTYFQKELHWINGSTGILVGGAEGDCPHSQFHLRASADPSRQFELDLAMRYVDELPNLEVERYLDVDARLAWKPSVRVEWAVAGRNLLHRRHPEFKSELNNVHTEAERSVYTSVTWGF
jgi:iron complex outermembrane receptor protein